MHINNRLVAASKENNVDKVKECIEHGADINSHNSWGSTALLWASINKNIELVQYLVEHGADISIKNEYGNTALHYAKKHSYTVLIHYLEQRESIKIVLDKEREVRISQI